MSRNITRNTIEKYSLQNPAIVIYIFENTQKIPDISGYFSFFPDLVDYMYEGDHGNWSFIYMHPLVGDPTWVSCEESEHALCR